MRAKDGINELPHPVPGTGHGLILRRLNEKCVQIDRVIERRAAGELEVDALRLLRVLGAQKGSAVGGEL